MSEEKKQKRKTCVECRYPLNRMVSDAYCEICEPGDGDGLTFEQKILHGMNLIAERLDDIYSEIPG